MNKKILTALANELAIPHDPGFMPGIPRNVELLANEDRFTASNFSEPLTAYAVGWDDPENLQELLDRICPAVPVGRRFEFKAGDNKNAFMADTDDSDMRAIGSPFKRVQFSGSSVNEKTHNKGLTIRIDKDDTQGEMEEERAVARMLKRLTRNDLIRHSAQACALPNSNKTWGSSSDPDADIRNLLVSTADKAGMYPNVVMFGEGSWHIRQDSYAGQDNPKGNSSYQLSPQQLQQKLMVDLVEVVKARYQSTATAKTKVVGNIVAAYFAEQNISKDDPSTVKRFVTNTEAGRYRVFRQESDKFIDISVEHYSNIVTTADFGGKLTITAGS